MVVETKEEVSEIEGTADEIKQSESKATSEPVAEGKGVTEVKETEVKPITFKTQDELDKHIQKQVEAKATSIAQKTTSTYQEQIKELKQQVKDATLIKQENALSKLVKSFKDNGEDSGQVADFEQAVKDLITRESELSERDDKIKEREQYYEDVTTSVKQVNAFTEALGLLLPDDDAGFISELTALAEKIAGASTDREKELIIELEKARLQQFAEADKNKPKRTKPDTNLPSAPGGRDLSKMSPSEQIQEGFKKLIKK
uniref:Scaffolding protein n=1 Tax=viral metagenome TaxID=1070528 RepID=A0A6M3II62_9ZZZZ